MSLPAAVRWHPAAAARTRKMLARQYPRTQVYGSTRRMLKDYPPQDVRELGIDPPRDPSRGYRAAATALWGAFVLACYSLAALPRDAVADRSTQYWPLLVLLAVGWQAGLVWLFIRLMAQQVPPTPPRGRRHH